MTTAAEWKRPERILRAARLLMFVMLECLVILQAVLANNDQFLTVTEMQRRGVAQGLPFIWHFGMWGDALMISGLVAFIVGRFADQWNWRNILFACIIAFIVTVFLGWTYTLSATPEAHALNLSLIHI